MKLTEEIEAVLELIRDNPAERELWERAEKQILENQRDAAHWREFIAEYADAETGELREGVLQQIKDNKEKADIIDALGEEWYDVKQYILKSKVERGKLIGENILLHDENKKLKEKAEKWDKHTQVYTKDMFDDKERLEQENKELKEKAYAQKPYSTVDRILTHISQCPGCQTAFQKITDHKNGKEYHD